jgi:suppressor of ftsI/bilirubin oxidase
MAHRRRDFLKAAAALGLAAAAPRARPDPSPGMAAGSPGDWCGTENPGQPLFVPSDRGFLGRLEPGEDRFVLRAAPLHEPEARGTAGYTLAYFAEHRGKRYRNPTLALRAGQRVQVDFVNDADEQTIVHWHGLGVDSRNDGNGAIVADPGSRFSYDFQVRERASLYWYHPHPHGLTGGQAYRGLFGMIEVDGADERRLRAVLDLKAGKSEIPLVLQDRRGEGYATSDLDRTHGFLGETVYINGTPCPYLDVSTRIYRFRILNASNARTYRLAFSTSDGKTLPFTLIGGDGGLLPAPHRCSEVFLASAERLDILVDLSDATAGDTIVLETRAFDPMHVETTSDASGAPHDRAAMHHAMPGEPADEGAHHHGGAFPEGTQRAVLQLRVRRRVAYRARVPAELSRVEGIDVTGAEERPLRLGFSKGRWRINDRVFVMGETPIEVRKNSIETWLIRNYFTSMPHAMHLHGFHFQVIERQSSPEQIASLRIGDRGLLATDLGWKDTVLVWPGESVRIAIDFKQPFPGPQTYVFHCHNLEHEDGGMMLGVRVA